MNKPPQSPFRNPKQCFIHEMLSIFLKLEEIWHLYIVSYFCEQYIKILNFFPYQYSQGISIILILRKIHIARIADQDPVVLAGCGFFLNNFRPRMQNIFKSGPFFSKYGHIWIRFEHQDLKFPKIELFFQYLLTKFKIHN